MQDLTAQVTSSLLQFPEVTLQALGEDEITLDSVLCGKFSGGRNGLAWLACGPQLEVVNSVTGERLSAYRFSGVNEQPPTVRVVKEFSWQKRTGLLVGLEEAEGSVLCLYDLGVSRVVKAVVLPGRVTAIEPIANHGGASVRTQHLHQSLRWLFGVAAVATDVGHLLLVDLCLDDLSCNRNGIEALDLEVVTRNPVEVALRRETVTKERRRLCFQLQNPSGTAVSTLCYISRSNQLVVGFSDGYLSLWNMKTLKREHHSQLEGGRIPVYAVTFQEPENDPRNCCYLWAVQSTQESEGDVVSLHLLQLAFGDRKRLASGQVMYEGLEYCDERYSVDLTGGVFPLRGQTRNIKLISCQTVEKFPNHVDREDSVNEEYGGKELFLKLVMELELEINNASCVIQAYMIIIVISPATSISIFSWQVKYHHEETPSTYLGVFDINRWYHAQMPDSLRLEEFLHDCPYFALWSLDTVISMTSPKLLLDILVHERSLSRGVFSFHPPTERFFHPSNYNFDGTCLLNSGVVHMTCTGFQKEALNFLKKSGPLIREAIQDTCNRRLVAGLQSPRLVDVQPSSLSQNDRDPRLRERAVGNNSILDQCGKILPRVERNLAAEKAKPYHLPPSRSREVSRPKPLSTVVNPANAGNVRTRENFLSTVLSNIREFWEGNEQKTGLSQGHSSRPGATEPPAATHPLPGEELRDAFVGMPVTKSSPKCSSLPNLADHPIPSCSAAQSPCRASTSFWASSPLRSNMPGSISRKNFSGASELNFLQTPPVAKRAQGLATSASGVPGFTPQSFPRPSLGTTPLATPSASPGRSVPPPLQAKEPGVSSGEENSNATWTARVISSCPVYSVTSDIGVSGKPRESLNDRDPRLRERAVGNNSILDQCGKILPRVERNLAAEKAKPYHLPPSRSREVSRPKPLSTVVNPANAGNVRTRENFLSTVLSNIREFWEGNEQKTGLSQGHSSRPGATEPPAATHPLPGEELRDAFVGMPVTKSSPKCSSLPNLADHPIPSCSAAQSPCRASTSFWASSPLRSNMPGSISRKNFSGASELNFLQTPPVAKRAQGLATSASGVPGFTPQSFPRPSLGTTPLATPSASPGRSVPPPLQAKEPGVSSGEENSNATWTARNDRDPRLRERAVGNNSILDQCGKILPRVERNLAAEKAKPYHLPPSRSREVSRPKPLSTVVNPANAGNVRTRENFLSTVLSNIREFWEGNEQKTGLSQGHSSRPGATEPPAATHPLPGEELRDAFVGMPVTKSSPKCSSLPNLADHPIPSCSAAQSPCRASTSFWASSPLRSNMPGSISRKNFSGASELNFLQTPPVAKRAQGLATSASGVPGFTPQSFPRPSLGTTPLATPSASPGRSVPPPLQAKEPGVSSGEENSNATWTARVTEDDKALSGPSSEDHHHHHHHHHGVVEDAWCESRSKTTLFALSNPEDDHAELEESSESTPGDGLEKVDVSKENSNISARSDQTTLEYHDAKSLSDFEDDVIFIAAKPAHSSTDATANFQESEKEGGSEMVEDKPFQMEQPDSSELGKKPGFVEESNAECLALPEDDKLVFKATEAAPLGTASEGETNQQESKMSSSSEEKAIPAAPNPELSAPPETDSESVISILDSEDVVSTHSENHLEGKRVDLPKEREHEAAEVEENVPFRQEEIPVSSCLAKTEEMNVVEDSVVKAQTSEEAPETSPYSELHPLGNLQYSYGTVEQQFACDLPDDKDGECDAAEADGELFISQSNFTLVLEGEEGEGEMGDPTSVGASKPTGATTEGKPVNSLGNNPENQEQVTNSVSTVTNDQESQNIAESLPYVPEPIKVAIAENLLDVIKDTRSKEFTSEVVEQSIHETIGKKVTRFQKAKAALTAVPEEVEDDEDEYVSTPRTRTRGQLSRSLRRAKEAVSEVLEEANEEMSLPEGSIATSAASKRTRGGKSSAGDEGTGQTDADHKIKMAVSPSRSARKQKSIRLKFTENIVKGQEVQPSDLLAVPPKRGRGRKMSSSEVSENSDLGLSKSSLPQTEFKLPVTPRRSARKGAQNLLADPEPLSTQEGIHSGGKGEILDTPRRSTRRVPRAKPEKMDAREQTPAQPDEELTTPRTTVRAGRRGRKRQSILEEGTGEEAFPQGPGGSPLLLEDINPSGHDETPRSLTDRITRTRSRKTAVRQKLPVEENESFLFSPPLTKLTKKCKAGEADHPVQLKDLDPDLSSQFVFSPPLLRSRRKNVSSISRIGKEPELLTKEEEDTKSIESVGKQKLKRGRTAKSKMKKSSKTTRKHDSWSPPSVEMKFISPFGSVLDRAIDRIGKICSVCKYV